jgi:chromodomain-helicase-DNA-binding protein 1
MLQGKDWDGEDSNEDDDSVDDLEVSDEDDSYYAKKSKGRQQGKVGRNVRSTMEHKSYRASSRQRRMKSSFEEDESSAEDSGNDSDEDFKSMTRRGVNLRKNGGRSTVSTNTSGRNSEVRTSTRSVRKVSYVESDESEEVDEGKKKKLQKVQSAYCSVKYMHLPESYKYFLFNLYLFTLCLI